MAKVGVGGWGNYGSHDTDCETSTSQTNMIHYYWIYNRQSWRIMGNRRRIVLPCCPGVSPTLVAALRRVKLAGRAARERSFAPARP